MTTSPSRQPKGIPVGGQFAAAAHPESGVSLDQNEGLSVAAGTDPALAEKLAAGGLKGSLAPYKGNNPDAGDNPHAYTSPGGRELILSSSDDEGFRAMYDDRYDVETFSLEITPEDATSEACVETVQDALWQLAINDANSEIPGGLRSADYYELQEVTLDRNPDGGLVGEIRARNDDDMETIVRHDVQTGTTTVYREGEWLDGLAADWELAAVFEGLRSEPDHGDFHRHTHAYFEGLLQHAAKDQDAPSWVKASVD
jgi:hypothetical protein